MSIPFQASRDKTERFDLLVAVNPVWETSWLVSSLPVDHFDPATGIRKLEDGGGSALNTACALACAGRRVLAVGRVGDDEHGRASVEALKRRGIEARIEIISDRKTKHNFLYVEEKTGATAFQASSPEGCADPWEEDPPGLHESRWLLLDRLPERAVDWLRERRAEGLSNALTRYGRSATGEVGRRLREALPYLDLLQLPESRSGKLSPDTSREQIHSPSAPLPLSDPEVASLLEQGLQLLVRTRGKDGVIINQSGTAPLTIPAKSVDLVDPTGAGDAFTAGLLDGLLSGAKVLDAAKRGIDWAARACRHLGARGWLDQVPPRAFDTSEQ